MNTNRCKQTNKICYTRSEAQHIINKVSRSHHSHKRGLKKHNSIPKSLYKCPYCNKYHTTHYKIALSVNKQKRRFEEECPSLRVVDYLN